VPIDAAFKAFRARRRFLPMAVAGSIIGLGLLLPAVPARADCASSCQGDYWACIEAYDSSTCGTQRAICVQSCIMSGGGGDNFGAIAYSPSTDKFGYSFDYPSQSEAEGRALRECRKVGGAEDCESVLWFKNVCGALATDGKGAYGADWAGTTKKAEAQAMDYCRANTKGACTVQKSFCVD
jgi:hypothetical protein